MLATNAMPGALVVALTTFAALPLSDEGGKPQRSGPQGRVLQAYAEVKKEWLRQGWQFESKSTPVHLEGGAVTVTLPAEGNRVIDKAFLRQAEVLLAPPLDVGPGKPVIVRDVWTASPTREEEVHFRYADGKEDTMYLSTEPYRVERTVLKERPGEKKAGAEDPKKQAVNRNDGAAGPGGLSLKPARIVGSEGILTVFPYEGKVRRLVCLDTRIELVQGGRVVRTWYAGNQGGASFWKRLGPKGGSKPKDRR